VSSPAPSVALVTLGCARNEVDSEELAGRLEADGWALTSDVEGADAVLVNTCGFVAAAKKDSIDAVLGLAEPQTGDGADVPGRRPAVIAVGCLAERYGAELADALPEADAVLSFDDYPSIGARLRAVLAGEVLLPHQPKDRRTLLPLAPTDRHHGSHAGSQPPGHGAPVASARAGQGAPTSASAHAGQGAPTSTLADLPAGLAPASGPRVLRKRLNGGATAPLKLASGCDRRCAFCAIPSFRGSFISRTPEEILAEARWLAASGVRELVLVSENSTSYGKDLGDVRLLESLLPQLSAVDGIEWVRVSYLQPAEMRPSLRDVLTGTPGVVPYFDLSFQHASEPLLRRMRRFGSADHFLQLLQDIRDAAPTAGVRSNVIVGFPGETEDDLLELERFLTGAQLDAVGVFGYSDEDGTEVAGLDGKVSATVIAERVEHITRLVEELTTQRAEDRVGEHVVVLVEELSDDGVEGRAAHQGPEIDGITRLDLGLEKPLPVGAFAPAVVVESSGADLIARVLPELREQP
jgi:ribosomal protein S12 methylthiotransferase